MGTVRSMTGYARARRTTHHGEIALSLKSVNHRGLDLRFQLAEELDPFENAMRGVLKRGLTRGHVEVRVSFRRSDASGVLALNRPLLDAYVAAFRSAAIHHGLHGEPDLNAAFRYPGMLGEGADEEVRPEFEAALVGALEEALAALNEFREREGAELAKHMLEENRAVRENAASMLEIRLRALPAFQARLHEKLGDLLKGAGVDAQRLAQEAALLADRSDIGEELARLRIHSQQLDALLRAGGEVGKKLDFLLQEMSRETNTVLSKTNGIGDHGLTITDLALATKAHVEKIREQALNVE